MPSKSFDTILAIGIIGVGAYAVYKLMKPVTSIVQTGADVTATTGKAASDIIEHGSKTITTTEDIVTHYISMFDNLLPGNPSPRQTTLSNPTPTVSESIKMDIYPTKPKTNLIVKAASFINPGVALALTAQNNAYKQQLSVAQSNSAINLAKQTYSGGGIQSVKDFYSGKLSSRYPVTAK
jgi:hypothetical protein